MCLPPKTHPVIESGLRRIGFAAHVPFADEGGAKAGLLQILREEPRSVRDRGVVVDDVVAVGVLTRENRRAARTAQRSRHHRVAEIDAIARQRVEVRRLQPGLALEEAERIVAMIVGQDEDDVARLSRGPLRFGHRCGERAAQERSAVQVHRFALTLRV